jgi:rubrerythrin
MSKGFKSIGIFLGEDLEFERNAVRTYYGFAERIEDLRIKEMFQSLAEDEVGHAAGLTEMLNKLKAGKFEVKFYCPRCGWALSFGKGPHVEDEVKCPMCGNVFRLLEKNGDYTIEEIKQ